MKIDIPYDIDLDRNYRHLRKWDWDFTRRFKRECTSIDESELLNIVTNALANGRGDIEDVQFFKETQIICVTHLNCPCISSPEIYHNKVDAATQDQIIYSTVEDIFYSSIKGTKYYNYKLVLPYSIYYNAKFTF